VLTGAETVRNNGSPSCKMRREGITYEGITRAPPSRDRQGAESESAGQGQ